MARHDSSAVQKTPQIAVTQKNAGQKFKRSAPQKGQQTTVSIIVGGKEITVKSSAVPKPIGAASTR
ncbi:MAG: hypothetical protein LBJ38_03060 [Oscillospiraceae bacterium]|nr:hypothetical protein [Oscillospiraceae bacterium]